MKKKLLFPLFLIAGLVFLTGCSKVSLTGTTNQGAGGPDGVPTGTPPADGGTPPADGGTPPNDGGTPPADGGGA